MSEPLDKLRCYIFGSSGGIKELRNPLVASMLHFGGSLGDRILELVQF